MTSPRPVGGNAYGRFVAISAAASGLIVGAAAGSFAALARSSVPLGLLVGYVAVRLLIARQVNPQLVRLRRWWSMPLVALATGLAFSLAPPSLAPYALGAAIASFVFWIVAHAILEVHFDPRGEHGGGWL